MTTCFAFGSCPVTAAPSPCGLATPAVSPLGDTAC
eukprot:CAMPEP_0181060968 /NCGR_PEP_ID=MMETSP1070-20121207/22265_1 /TAXON_ID=265543 /ORGANISM="Minutocellus polymorphus, Strain NH13" /LENGTH=34 /DNA_ID= /DNA_START= /DNA_END= /DNA_ORIENTATION=